MNKKKVSKLALLGVAGVTIAGAYLGNYFYDLAINPKKSKEKVFKNIDSEDEVKAEETSGIVFKDDLEWFEKFHKQEEIIESFDELKLSSYKFLNEGSKKWAIVVHGYTSESKYMAGIIKNFYEKGYNVIAPDLRAHGHSEGNYIGMGWHDRLDVISWINEIIKENQDSEIVLFGVSMGAATVMMASGEELPSNVKVIIEDCGYTSVWDQFKQQLKEMYKVPSFPIMNVSNIIVKLRAKYSLKEASAIKAVKKSTVPMMFIHGDKDKFVPFEMMNKLYEAANCDKAKLVIHGAGHAKSATVNPQVYWENVWTFIEKYV